MAKPQEAKKRYEQPRLKVYGDVRKLTRAANGFNKDGGPNNTKSA